MYAVLKCTTVEGFTRTEKEPFWIDEKGIKHLFTPQDNQDETFSWEFYEDRNHLINAGY